MKIKKLIERVANGEDPKKAINEERVQKYQLTLTLELYDTSKGQKLNLDKIANDITKGLEDYISYWDNLPPGDFEADFVNFHAKKQ